jgi:hypothetical protein
MGVFWKRESRHIKWHEFRPLTCQHLFCLHVRVYRLAVTSTSARPGGDDRQGSYIGDNTFNVWWTRPFRQKWRHGVAVIKWGRLTVAIRSISRVWSCVKLQQIAYYSNFKYVPVNVPVETRILGTSDICPRDLPLSIILYATPPPWYQPYRKFATFMRTATVESIIIRWTCSTQLFSIVVSAGCHSWSYFWSCCICCRLLSILSPHRAKSDDSGCPQRRKRSMAPHGALVGTGHCVSVHVQMKWCFFHMVTFGALQDLVGMKVRLPKGSW